MFKFITERFTIIYRWLLLSTCIINIEFIRCRQDQTTATVSTKSPQTNRVERFYANICISSELAI